MRKDLSGRSLVDVRYSSSSNHLLDFTHILSKTTKRFIAVRCFDNSIIQESDNVDDMNITEKDYVLLDREIMKLY